MPAAKIPNWRDDLHNTYIIQVNDQQVHNRLEIIQQIDYVKELNTKKLILLSLQWKYKVCTHNMGYNNYTTIKWVYLLTI